MNLSRHEDLLILVMKTAGSKFKNFKLPQQILFVFLSDSFVVDGLQRNIPLKLHNEFNDYLF
jgi:hypothetical protein